VDPRLQAKLLRALQERVIDRVGHAAGAGRPSVSSRPPPQPGRGVRAGRSTEDLLFRLNVVNLKLPPLRERPADVIELATHFIKKYSAPTACRCAHWGGGTARPRAQPLPGNVRRTGRIPSIVPCSAHDCGEIGMDGIGDAGRPAARPGQEPPAVAHATFVAETGDARAGRAHVADVERDLILETLKHCLGNRTHAPTSSASSIRTLRNQAQRNTRRPCVADPTARRRARCAGRLGNHERSPPEEPKPAR